MPSSGTSSGNTRRRAWPASASMTSGPDGISPALSTSWAPSFLLSVSGGTGGHRGGGGDAGDALSLSSSPAHSGLVLVHGHGPVSSLLLFSPSSFKEPLPRARLSREALSSGSAAEAPGRRWGPSSGQAGQWTQGCSSRVSLKPKALNSPACLNFGRCYRKS